MDYKVNVSEDGAATIEPKNIKDSSKIMMINKELLSIDFGDKKNRNVGFNTVEINEFSQICKLGIQQVMECYSERHGKYNRIECEYYCKNCPYKIQLDGRYNGVLYVNESIYDPKYLTELLLQYISYRANAKSYVYFISDGNCVKIGKANNVNERVSEIQVGNPNDIYIICTIPCKNEKSANEVEKILHKLYHRHHSRGEWYWIIYKIKTVEFRDWFGVDSANEGKYEKYID